jgi:hypothetical protein
VVHGHLHPGVTNNDVSTDEVSFDPRDHNDPIRIPDDSILLNHILVAVRCRKTNTKVAGSSYVFRVDCVSVSTEPVRTEPVTACAVAESYTAAGSSRIAVSYKDII